MNEFCKDKKEIHIDYDGKMMSYRNERRMI